MVLAYHTILSAYGFWLPNDPRGSWSDVVRVYELRVFGPAMKVATRRSVADAPHDRARRLAAKKSLVRPPVRFTGEQAGAIARGFAMAAADNAYSILACAILPDHVHYVVAEHPRKAEGLMAHLKAAASRQLTVEGLHPFGDQPLPCGRLPSPWAAGAWHVYLNTDVAVKQAIAYVEGNPVKAGLRRQRWSFVRSI